MNRSVIRSLVGAAVLGIMIGPCLQARAQAVDSEKIDQLFQDIKHHANEAEYDAELLESYTRSGTSWQSHATRISEMKSHVNDLGRDFDDAKRLRAEGSEWQKKAIDEIEPLLQGMANHLSTTINHLNENRSKTSMQPWVEHVKANREFANQAANLIRDYVAFGQAQAKFEALEKRVQQSASPGQE